MRICVALWLCLISLLTMSAGCGPLTFTVGGSPEDQQLRTEILQPADRRTRDRIALIDVDGIMVNARRPELLREGENPVALFDEKLKAAASDPRVQAVIVRLNTPGGTVTASDAMYRLLLDFRRDTGKPVVALMMDVAASGGYYLACAADHIVAYPTTITGSIGVLFQTISVKPALERWGVFPEAFVSGSHKGTASPLSTLTDEQRLVLQQLVNEFHERFVNVVTSQRSQIDASDLASLTDGRVFSGVAALEHGLIDEVGDLRAATLTALQMAGVERANIVGYRRPLTYIGSPYAKADVRVTTTPALLADYASLDQGFYYLWAPGLIRD